MKYVLSSQHAANECEHVARVTQNGV